MRQRRQHTHICASAAQCKGENCATGCTGKNCGSTSHHPQILRLPLLVSRVNMAICSHHHATTPPTHAHLCICSTMQWRKLCHRLHGRILRQYVTPPPDPPPAIVSKPSQYGHLFTPCDNATNNTHAHLCICRVLRRRKLCHQLQWQQLRQGMHGRHMRQYVTPPGPTPRSITSPACFCGRTSPQSLIPHEP
jgi:hypothetical protein